MIRKIFVVVFLSAFFFSGCAVALIGAGVGGAYLASTQQPLVDAAKNNRDNLQNLTFGISKHFALEIMGTKPVRIFKDKEDYVIPNPYREQSWKRNGKNYEALYFVTEAQGDDLVVTDKELTPLVFEDGKLIGWDRKILSRYQ